jgi:MFS family permease
MTISLFLLASCFHSQAALGSSLGIVATVCLMVYVICFAFSMGPIAWILVAEVFPLRLRGRGVAAATLGSGASNTIVAYTFLALIQAAGKSLTFCIYAGFCILTLLFTRFVIPETKGRELESISTHDAAPVPD